MGVELIGNALGLVLQLLIPAIAAMLGAVVLAGILQAATQIEDGVIYLATKVAALSAVLYLASNFYSSNILEFARRMWGGADFYK